MLFGIVDWAAVEAIEILLRAPVEDEDTSPEAYCPRTAGADSYKLKAYDPPQIVEFEASPTQTVLQFVDVVFYARTLPVKHWFPTSRPNNRDFAA